MRAVVLATGCVIHPQHVSISSPLAAQDTPVPSLDDLERAHVRHVLEITDGHKGKAADLLGVSRPRLNRLIEKYGIE